MFIVYSHASCAFTTCCLRVRFQGNPVITFVCLGSPCAHVPLHTSPIHTLAHARWHDPQWGFFGSASLLFSRFLVPCGNVFGIFKECFWSVFGIFLGTISVYFWYNFGRCVVHFSRMLFTTHHAHIHTHTHIYMSTNHHHHNHVYPKWDTLGFVWLHPTSHLSPKASSWPPQQPQENAGVQVVFQSQKFAMLGRFPHLPSLCQHLGPGHTHTKHTQSTHIHHTYTRTCRTQAPHSPIHTHDTHHTQHITYHRSPGYTYLHMLMCVRVCTHLSVCVHMFVCAWCGVFCMCVCVCVCMCMCHTTCCLTAKPKANPQPTCQAKRKANAMVIIDHTLADGNTNEVALDKRFQIAQRTW